MATSAVGRIVFAFDGQRAVSQANRSLRMLARESAVSGRAMDGFGRVTGRAMKGVLRFFSRQISNVFRSFFFGLRIWAIMGGAAVSGFAVSAIKSFMLFDKKLRETTSLIAGSIASSGGAGSMAQRLKRARKDSQKEYLAYRRDMLAMSVGLRQTPTDLTGGLKEVVSAGYVGRGAAARGIGEKILSAGAMGAAAGGGDVQTSTRMLIQLMNALGLKGKATGVGGAGAPLTGNLSSKRIMDRMFAAVNYGVNVTYSDLAAGMANTIGPAGVAMNPNGKPGRGKLALDQILANVVIGSQRGMTVSRSTIGMNNLLEKILNPTDKSVKEFQKLGLTPGTELLQNGLIGTGSAFDKISKAIHTTYKNTGDATKSLNVLFHDQRGWRMAATLFTTSMKDQNSVIKLIEASSGSLQAAFDENGKSLDAQTKKFKVLFETLKIGAGIAMMPTVTRFLNAGTDIVNQITGGEKGMQANSAYFAAKKKMPGLTPNKFSELLTPQTAKAFKSYRQFAAMDVKGIASSAFTAVSQSISGWWDGGGKKTFLDLLTSIVDLAFSSLGTALDNSPGVYTFAVKMGAKIADGILHQLKSSIVGNGKGGGLMGFLGGGPQKLFAGGNKTETALAMGIGLTALTGLAPRFAGGGLKGRASMGMLAAGAGALGGMDSTASMMMGAAGFLLPMTGIFSKRYNSNDQFTGRYGYNTGELKSKIGGFFRPPINPVTAAAQAAAAGVAGETVGSMVVNATSVVINASKLGVGTGGGGMGATGGVVGFGPGQTRPRGPNGRIISMAEYNAAQGAATLVATPATPKYSRFQRARYGIGRGVGRLSGFTARPGVGAASTAALMTAMALAGGGGTGSKVGSLIGGVAPLALMLLGPEMAPLAMGGSMIGGTVGGMIGASFDAPPPSSAAAMAAMKQRLKGYTKHQRTAKGYGSNSQSIYGLMQAVTGERLAHFVGRDPGTGLPTKMYRRYDANGNITAESSKPLGYSSFAGLTGAKGMASVKAVSFLAPILNKIAHAHTAKQMMSAQGRLGTVLTAINSPAVTAAVGAIIQNETERIKVELANKTLAKQMKRSEKVKQSIRDSMAAHSRNPYDGNGGNLSKGVKGALELPSMPVITTDIGKVTATTGTMYTTRLAGNVSKGMPTVDKASSQGWAKIGQSDSLTSAAIISAAQQNLKLYQTTLTNGIQGIITDTLISSGGGNGGPPPAPPVLGPDKQIKRGDIHIHVNGAGDVHAVAKAVVHQVKKAQKNTGSKKGKQ